MTARRFRNARCVRFNCALLLYGLLLAGIIAGDAAAQLVPTDQDALRRMMERKQREREQQTPEVATPGQSVDPHTDRQTKLLDRASEALKRAQEQIDSGEHRQAAGTLMQIRRALREPRVAHIEAMLAHIALLNDQPDHALRFIEPWTVKPAPVDGEIVYDANLFDAYLMAGWALRATGEPQKALVLLDWLTGEETESANARYAGSINVVRAAAETGRTLVALGRYRDALAAFRFAQSYARSQLADYTADQPLKSILSRIDRDRRHAQRLWDIEKFGLVYVRFREAEVQRRTKKDYAKALAIYQDIINNHEKWYAEEAAPGSDEPGGVAASAAMASPDAPPDPNELKNPFVEASRLYACLCMVELDQMGRAVRTLRAFAESEPRLGLYKGEAWLELGRIALERQLAPNVADEYFRGLDEWIADVRKEETDRWNFVTDLPGVRKATSEQIKPPSEEKKRDYWGNIKRQPIEPGELVNRATAPWYLDDLEENCAKFRGFLAFAAGDGEAAMGHYKRIPKLDPMITAHGDLGTNPNDYHRLKFGAEKGYLVTYPQELKLYSGRQLFAVLLGEFYYVTQQFDKATELCDRLLANEFGRLHARQADYPAYLTAIASYRNGVSGAKAREYLLRILQRSQISITQIRATFAFANVTPPNRSPEDDTAVVAYLARLAGNSDAGKYAMMARIELGRRVIASGDPQGGENWLRSVPANAGDHHAIAAYLLRKYAEAGLIPKR